MSDIAAATAADQQAAPTAAASSPPPGAKKEASASLWADAFRDLRKRPTVIAPVLFLMVIASMAIFPSLWTSQDPKACNVSQSINVAGGSDASGATKFLGSWLSSAHPFGYDYLGCDYYARAIYGTRPSLMIAVGATIGIVILGGLAGMLAGYFGGWVDAIISRLLDIVFALPFLLGAIVFLTVVRDRSVWTIIAVITILGWTTIGRLMRGSVIQAKGLDYVQAARALGASHTRLMFKHILPNAVAPVIVYATIALGAFVSAEATLSFLGVGLIPPDVSWGIMINQNDDRFDEFPLLLVFPCILLVGTVLSFILLGDALRDALDPKLR
jgi:peptide/nickel transport system permease protein/oligopeptide transport system permease protein